MPTHEIAIDMDRLSLQVMKSEKLILGQAANDKGYRSVGDYVRHLIQAGIEIEDRRLAEKYKSVRAHRYAQAVALCVIGSVVVWQSIFATLDIRRTSSRIRMQRREQIA